MSRRSCGPCLTIVAKLLEHVWSAYVRALANRIERSAEGIKAFPDRIFVNDLRSQLICHDGRDAHGRKEVVCAVRSGAVGRNSGLVSHTTQSASAAGSTNGPIIFPHSDPYPLVIFQPPNVELILTCEIRQETQTACSLPKSLEEFQYMGSFIFEVLFHFNREGGGGASCAGSRRHGCCPRRRRLRRRACCEFGAATAW